MFIDIHAHVYKENCPPADGKTQFCTPTQLIKTYDEMDIEKAILLPLIGPEVYLPQSNEDIIEIAEASDGRFLPFCNIDPRGISNSPDAPLDIWLKHYKKRGCKGIGEVMPNLPFMNLLVQNLFKHVESVGFPLIFDISDRIGGDYGLYDDSGLPQLESSLRAFPKLKILGHGPAFWSEIAKLETPGERGTYPTGSFTVEGVVPKLLRRYPNMYGDLSAGSGYNALKRNPDYAIKFLNEFQDKLLFGTDICSPLRRPYLREFLLDLRKSNKISELVFNKIARLNAIKLLNL